MDRIITDQDLVTIIDDMKYNLKSCKTPLQAKFNDLLNGFIKQYSLDSDQHYFAALPKDIKMKQDYAPIFIFKGEEIKVRSVTLTPLPYHEQPDAVLELENGIILEGTLKSVKHYDCKMRFVLIEKVSNEVSVKEKTTKELRLIVSRLGLGSYLEVTKERLHKELGGMTIESFLAAHTYEELAVEKVKSVLDAECRLYMIMNLIEGSNRYIYNASNGDLLNLCKIMNIQASKEG